MIEWLRGVVGRRQPHREADSAAEPDVGDSDAGPADERTRELTGLFRCLACDTVYVAVEMETCRSCQGDLREVPATLSGSR